MSDEKRVPAYPSRSLIAYELDISESTVDSMVDRGVLPRPIKLSSGCVRWCWAEVQAALTSLKPLATAAGQSSDPYIAGVRNAKAP
jgi:predicted DNA-binding transcriptional regulator AlpA